VIIDDEGGHLKCLDDTPDDKPRKKVFSSWSAASHRVPILMPGGETWQDHHPVESNDAPPAEEGEILFDAEEEDDDDASFTDLVV
jgi:hypothetical protein